MSNIKKYKDVFLEAFSVDKSSLDNLEYNSITDWDSVGHMGLIAGLEEAFDVMLEMDDIIDFSGFVRGKEILEGYDIVL